MVMVIGGKPLIELVDTATFGNSEAYSGTLNFGALAPGLGRHLIIAATSNDDDVGDDSFSFSATIGGVAATSVRTNTHEIFIGTSGAWLGIAAVPDGISGPVTLDINSFNEGTMDKTGIALFRAVGLSSATPFSSGEDNDGRLNMNVPENGFGIVAVAKAGSSEVLTLPGTDLKAYESLYGAVGLEVTPGAANHGDSDGHSIVYATWTFK